MDFESSSGDPNVPLASGRCISIALAAASKNIFIGACFFIELNSFFGDLNLSNYNTELSSMIISASEQGTPCLIRCASSLLAKRAN
ncbi:MAG: hypothetical protein WBP64_15385 [Nitrososphaeraceae archaeon]